MQGDAIERYSPYAVVSLYKAQVRKVEQSRYSRGTSVPTVMNCHFAVFNDATLPAYFDAQRGREHFAPAAAR